MCLVIALLLGALITGCATNEQEGMGTSGNLSQAVSGGAVGAEDSSFAREACQTGTAEMEIGRLATLNTRNKELRKFARSLSEDHARAEEELATLFSRKAIAPEAELASDFQSSLQRLAGLKGGEFDAAFKQQVISDHERAIELFSKQAEEGSDADLKAFAQKRLPQLRAHLETARGLPVSSDTEGPKPELGVNSVLQIPAARTLR